MSSCDGKNTRHIMVVCRHCKKEIDIEAAWIKKLYGKNVYYCPEHYDSHGKSWERRGGLQY